MYHKIIVKMPAGKSQGVMEYHTIRDIKYIFNKMKLLTFILTGLIGITCPDRLTAINPVNSVKAGVVIESDGFTYGIGKDGRNLWFIDKLTGIDYLENSVVSYCAYVVKDGKQFPVSSVSREGNILRYDFGKAGFSASILIGNLKGYVTLEVAENQGNIESLTFINLPLKLEGIPDEPFAACVLSLNLQTHIRQLPALQTSLWATCYERFSLKGAKIAMLGVPMKSILTAIREVMKESKEIPYSEAGGAWAQLSEQGYGSYLLNFGTLTESTVNEWIKKCKSVGFNQIDNHGGGSDFFRFGSFELNRDKWPDGWEHFRKINKSLHEAGISSIFHTYAFFIDKDSRFVTPVPSMDLGYFKEFTLTEAIGPSDKEIPVKEPTSNVSAVTGFHVANSRTIRIGDELIEFSGTTSTEPYKFTGCKRAANGTSASAHQKNEKAYHLKEMFGRFVPGPETPLFKEIARLHAEIVNQCNFDGIYFDAIDASDILGGPENFWYYGSKFIVEVAKHLNRPVGMEMSSMSHLWWHYRSRWQAWDAPRRGYKRFVDIHSASLKSKEIEHGYWRGHTPLINKLAPMENGAFLLPLQLGWWLNFTWDPPQTEPTFTDDIEYLCCKMTGNNAGLAILGGIGEKEEEEKPAFHRLNTIIRQYEELRHKNYFNDSIKALLRQPGKEYTLFSEESGEWNLKPVNFQKHKVTSLDNQSAQWKVFNEFTKQPVKLRIETLLSVQSYNDSNNIVLTDFSGENEFSHIASAPGVSGTLKGFGEKDIYRGKTGIFKAESSGKSPREGSWICLEKKFEPWMNMSKHQALGVWIKGDGNGELLNFRLETPEQFSAGVRGDHYVKIDFEGWKYFELVEIESSEFSNYIWPGSEISLKTSVKDLFVYKSYMHSVQFDKVDKLQLWYNNIPSGKEVSCVVGPVKAIPTVYKNIENPSITIGGEKIVFPIKMESGMYLEFRSSTDCKLFGSKGELLCEIIPKGKIPNLANGLNEISFSCNGTDEINPRVQVTVINEGDPLIKK